MSTGGVNAKWIVSTGRSPDAPVRLFAFPHAGGTASAFGAWPALVGPAVDVCPVQLPGRGARTGEPMPERIDVLIRALVPALAPDMDRPFVLFGHDMGALVAFELARALRRGGHPMPSAILVAGALPPQVPRPQTSTLGDSELMVRLRELGRVPDELLGSERDGRRHLDAMLPIIRTDLVAVECYGYVDEAPLDMEIVALRGAFGDGAGPGELAGWSVHTRGSFRVEELPGHGYARGSAERAVTRIVAAVCRKVEHAASLQRRHGEILGGMRRELDALDDELMTVLTRRLHLCDRIAEVKRQHGIPMMQPHRIDHVKLRCAERAHKAGIDPQFVIDLYTRIIEETCRRETRIIDDED